MTDEPNYASRRPGDGSTPDAETQAGDPELAALVPGTDTTRTTATPRWAPS